MSSLLTNIYAQVGAVVMILVCSAAMLMGDRNERLGATVYLVAWLATLLIQEQTGLKPTLPLGPLAVDLVVLGFFAALAWRAERSWPVWAAGFQAIALCVHVLYLFDLNISPRAYWGALAISGYGVLGTLAVATWYAWRERRALSY